MADWWGRRTPIAVGGVFMILGGLIGTFANGYGSEYNLDPHILEIRRELVLTNF